MQGAAGLSNTRYYQVLGLRRTDALPEEIKRAYKRLSLKYHPDRNRDDPTTTAKFQQGAQAYNVLSSPQKRQIYDAYGEKGVEMYESYLSFASDDAGGAGTLPMQPVTMALLLCTLLSAAVICATAFGVLLLLYLQGDIHAPLAAVFAPVWAVDAAALCCVYVALLGTQRSTLAVYAIALLALTTFHVLLCLKVDNVTPLSWTLVFLPLFLYEVLYTLLALRRCTPSAHEELAAAARASGAPPPPPYSLHVAREMQWAAARVAVVVLIPVRLDGALGDVAWTLVLSPLWLLLVLELLQTLGPARAPAATERDTLVRQLARVRLGAIAVFAALLGLLCLRLDGHVDTWTIIFAPLLVGGSLYLCCCCCLCTAMLCAPRADARDVPPSADDGAGSLSGGSPLPTDRSSSLSLSSSSAALTPRPDTDSLGRAELGRAEPHGEHAPLLPAQAPAASRYGAA